MPQLHSHFSTGEPCFCPWFRLSKEHLHKQAATWDEIRNFKKIRKNQEAQELISRLEQKGYGETERQMKWIPWLLQQIRQGYVRVRPDDEITRWDDTPLDYELPGVGGTYKQSLNRPHWQHMTDWLNSTHRTRQGVDPQLTSIQDVYPRMEEWTRDLKNQQARLHADAGVPIHTYPDNWTLRELGPHELKNEGEIMGHCVGGYSDEVANGNLRVLSLRDHKGEPHVTTGISYENGLASPWIEDDNGGYQYDRMLSKPSDPGYIYQHYGKGNAAPKPEYNERYRQYFETLPLEHRPLSEDYEEGLHIDDIDGLREELERAGKGTDVNLDHMGLPRSPINHRPSVDWDRLHEDLVRNSYYNRDPYFNSEDGDALWEALERWGDPKQYEKDVLQPSEQENMDEMDQWYYREGGPYSHEYNHEMGEGANNYSYPDSWDDDEWRDEFEHQGIDADHMDEQARANYSNDWEEAEAAERDAAYQENPRFQANSYMYDLLNNYAEQQKKIQGQQPTTASIQKQADRLHFHIHYQHPCHCPWGAGEEHVGHVKQAAKIDWLRERKDMQDDEGKALLDKLEKLGYASHADKMLPWIVREYRRKRVYDHPTYPDHHLAYDNNEGGLNRGYHFLSPERVKEWQGLLDEMKQHRQGIDVMQHTIHELKPKLDQFKDFLEEKRAPHYGEIVHHFPHNDWTVRRLQNAEEATREGNQMGHCVGSYGTSIENGDTLIYSLRDQHNHPHATMEIEPDGRDDQGKPVIGPRSHVGQFYGKEDSPPKEEYADMMNEWLEPHGLYAESFKPWWEDYYTVPGAQTVNEYVGEWNGSHDGPEPPDDYSSAMIDAEENGLEGPELQYDDPEMDRVWKDHTSYHPQERQRYWGSRPYHFDPSEAEELFDASHDRNHLNELMGHYKDWATNDYDSTDPEHRAVNEWWNQRLQENTNPETGEWEWPRRSYPRYHNQPFNLKYETALDRWWATNRERYPQLPGEEWQGADEQPPIPEPLRQGLFAKHGRTTPPLYYRWVFSPDTGEVEIGHNDENHPAKVRYHKELAGQLNRPNLVHGYAYRLLGGWRLTDWEHRPVDDPFVSAQVLQGLGAKTSVQNEDAWLPAEHDYDKTHYGLPQPKLEDSLQS